MKLVMLILAVCAVFVLIDSIKELKIIIETICAENLKKGKISDLKKTGSSWTPEVGTRANYTFIVQLEDSGRLIEVPTLHHWGLTKYASSYYKRKFGANENGKIVDVYYNKEKNIAIISTKKHGLLVNAVFMSLCGIVGIVLVIIWAYK